MSVPLSVLCVLPQLAAQRKKDQEEDDARNKQVPAAAITKPRLPSASLCELPKSLFMSLLLAGLQFLIPVLFCVVDRRRGQEARRGHRRCKQTQFIFAAV